MKAVTAEAMPPTGIPPVHRSGKLTARTALPRTIWAIQPVCGSPSCARTAGVARPNTRPTPRMMLVELVSRP
jgi:hypothetical protein